MFLNVAKIESVLLGFVPDFPNRPTVKNNSFHMSDVDYCAAAEVGQPQAQVAQGHHERVLGQGDGGAAHDAVVVVVAVGGGGRGQQEEEEELHVGCGVKLWPYLVKIKSTEKCTLEEKQFLSHYGSENTVHSNWR